MDFLTCFYAQQSKNAASLLLQQYQRGQTHILFACVCAGEGERTREAGTYMAKGLLKWFRGLDLERLAGNAEKNLKNNITTLEDHLRDAVLRIDHDWVKAEREEERGEGSNISLAGIFSLEEQCLLIHRGSVRMYLLNTAFGWGHARRLDDRNGNEELKTEQGVLQQNIGMLFAAEPFFDWVTEKMLAEGLFAGEAVTEEQMERHLRELAIEGERKGGSGSGAVYIRTVES